MPLEIPTPRASGVTTSTPVPLYWCEYGPESAAPLLVLHGGPGALHNYLLPQYLALAEQRRLIFYDQRGGGKSRSDSQDEITWRTQVDDLGSVARELQLYPLDIVAYSWGAVLALLYTLETLSRRELLKPRRLALVNPAPLTRAYRVAFEAEFQRRQTAPAIVRARDELTASGLRERDLAAYRQRAFELSVAGYFADASMSHQLTPFRVMGRVQESIWRSLGDYDIIAQLEQLRELTLPSLVVHGWYDPIPMDSSYLAARALLARFVVLEASGHVPHVEQPRTLFNVIEHFLDGTNPNGARE
ncbi:MAG: alpha/beta fold hydrolase [Gemmatimonadaceae bacterium]